MALALPKCEDPVLVKGIGNDLIVAGYASVEMVDKQGDLITRPALRDAFTKFMKADGFRNVQLAHSNIQVGEVVSEYTDTGGRIWKSEVDDTGMFVVIKLRGDIEKAREVAAEIRKGNLRSFSIGGQAFERINKTDSSRGDYREISRMELHEVTICEKGINPEAQFRILKEDKGETMTDPMNELQNVLERLSKKLDDAEQGETNKEEKTTDEKMAYSDDGNTEKGKMPPQFESKDKDDDDDDDSDDDKKDKKDDEKMKKNDMDDVITTDYLQWLENTVKSAGYDPTSARTHFDGVEKGYGKGEDGASHRGQPPLGIVGEGVSAPKADFGAGGKGNKTVIKAEQFINAENLTPAQIEEAYTVYKAAALEQHLKSDLGNYFETRLQKEVTEEKSENARQQFDSREPLEDLQKAVLALSERIDNVTSDSESFQKSVSPSVNIPVPDTGELATMTWDDVHRLADRALQGGDN